MTIIQSIFLGAIQGITEFLPISSSGHLILVPKFFNWPDQGLAFDTVLHLATSLAIIIALRKEIWSILSLRYFCHCEEPRRSGAESKRRSNPELKRSNRPALLILLAIIPAGLIGLLFNNWIENNLRSTTVVAFSLIIWGIVLWTAEKYSQKQKISTDNLEKINWHQSLAVGLAQVIALIPGTSRSGITITGGLFSRLNKETAVKFSFLIGLPIILAAGILKLSELLHAGLDYTLALPLITGFLSALITGILSIQLLLWISRKSSFTIFAIYRIILGIILLIIF